MPLLPRPWDPAGPRWGVAPRSQFQQRQPPTLRPGILRGSLCQLGSHQCWLPPPHPPRPSQRSFQNSVPTALLEIDGVKRAFHGLIDWLPLSCSSTCFRRGGSQPRLVPGRWLSASPRPVDFSTRHHRTPISLWKLGGFPLRGRLEPGKQGRRRAPCRRGWIQCCRAGAISQEEGGRAVGTWCPRGGHPYLGGPFSR